MKVVRKRAQRSQCFYRVSRILRKGFSDIDIELYDISEKDSQTSNERNKV